MNINEEYLVVFFSRKKINSVFFLPCLRLTNPQETLRNIKNYEFSPPEGLNWCKSLNEVALHLKLRRQSL